MFKFVTLLIVTVGIYFAMSKYDMDNLDSKISSHISQFKDQDKEKLIASSNVDNAKRMVVHLGVVLMWGCAYFGQVAKLFTKVSTLALMLLLLSGCRKPFEPVKLEIIEPNEVGFLISNNDVKEQSATSAEEFKGAMVNSQQVKIPQMWIQLGYEYLSYNGEWRDAARLIKVDTSSVTREWTADPKSGTSDRNEAIWVMTSDQVEFSTGWTCTAKIQSKDDAAKFLSNYRNGTLEKVMDQEVRAKIQSTFGLAVTDLPMDTLRMAATPIIVKTTDDVKTFFSERGITITNIGITGGFVYKNPKIQEKMAEVFTAEQEKSIAIAKTVAQQEENKQIQLEAEAKAQAILTEKKAEAEGIQAVADAKAYEIEKAQENQEIYLKLKELEIDKTRLERWDGKYPVYFMGTGGESPSLLMQVPQIPLEVK